MEILHEMQGIKNGPGPVLVYPMFNPLGERFTNVTQSMYVRSNMLNLALLVFCLAGTGMIPAIETTTEKLNEAE